MLVSTRDLNHLPIFQTFKRTAEKRHAVRHIIIIHGNLYSYAYINIPAHGRFVHNENISSISKKNRTSSSTDNRCEHDSVILQLWLLWSKIIIIQLPNHK